MDRISLSVAIIPMASLFSWTESTKGLVQALFFLGYMTTQISAGALADARGGRLVLAVAVLLWSLATLATPPAAHYSIPALLVMRVALGAAEGAAMPAMNAIIAASVPVHERARTLSFVYSGMYAGTILGLLAAPPLFRVAGWQSIFYTFGSLGLAWVAVFLLTTAPHLPHPTPVSPPHFYSSLPSDKPDPQSHSFQNPQYTDHHHPHPHPHPHHHIEEPDIAHLHPVDHDEENHTIHLSLEGPAIPEPHTTFHPLPENPTVCEMLSRPCVWAIIVAHFCCTWGYFVLLTWLPSFMYSKYNLDIKSSAFLCTAPWIAMFIFANVGGWLADYLIRCNFSVTHSRKIMQSVGFFGPAIFLGFLCTAQNATIAIVYVSIALALSSFSQSGVYANHQDIGPNVAGTLLGISNTFASIPGLIGVYVSGVVLDVTDHNWNTVFAMAIVFYAIGLVVYNLFATSERQW